MLTARSLLSPVKPVVEAGTERAWEFCEKYDIPRVFFVTDIDDDNADYARIVEDLRALYGKKIAPFHLPVKEDNKFTGYVNVVKMMGRKCTDDGNKFEDVAIEDMHLTDELQGELEALS